MGDGGIAGDEITKLYSDQITEAKPRVWEFVKYNIKSLLILLFGVSVSLFLLFHVSVAFDLMCLVSLSAWLSLIVYWALKLEKLLEKS